SVRRTTRRHALARHRPWGETLREDATVDHTDYRLLPMGDARRPTHHHLSVQRGSPLACRHARDAHAFLYAGWGWTLLPLDGHVPGADAHLEDTGYAAGLQFQHPFAGTTDGWLRLGALYNHIEVEATDGGVLADSGH